MKRRDFIRSSSLASAYFAVPSFLKPIDRLFPLNSGRNLVVIQLNGGNDWLNTVIPYKNDLYYKARPKLGIKPNAVLPLANDLGFNSALAPLKEIYDNSEMAIVNNVGYPDPDRSHFRSTDIWHTASGSNEYLDTGWLGRFLDFECKSSSEAFEISHSLSLALKGKELSAVSAYNLKALHNELRSPFYNELVEAMKKEAPQADNQEYMYKTLVQTHSGVDYLFEKNAIVSNAKEYPNNIFSKHLKNVASLIASGPLTKVYYVHLNGFDTHAQQSEKHRKLLETYAQGVSTFISNLKELDKWHDTLIFTFSEFGRRVEENASGGTDHGTAGNVFIFGKNLRKKGIVNELPDLANLDDGDLRFSIDFRSIYKDILTNWLGADAGRIIPAAVKKIEIV